MNQNPSDILLQQFLQVMIQLLTPIVLGLLGALLTFVLRWVKSKLSAEQLDFVVKLVDQYVQAAEQYGLNGTLARLGQEKKAWALNAIDVELQKRGIHIDVNMLEAMIEAAVNGFDFPHAEKDLPMAKPESSGQLTLPI